MPSPGGKGHAIGHISAATKAKASGSEVDRYLVARWCSRLDRVLQLHDVAVRDVKDGRVSSARAQERRRGLCGAFCLPAGLTVDREGNVYVADFGNHAVRKITPLGIVTTLMPISQ